MLDRNIFFIYRYTIKKSFQRFSKKYVDKKKNYLGILNHIVPHFFNNNIFTLFISHTCRSKTYSNDMHMIAFIYFYFELKGYSFYS